MEKVFLAAFMFVVLGILVAGVKKAKKGEIHEDFLSLKVTKGIQGFAAVGIMLHHLAQNATEFGNVSKGLIGIYNDFGVIFTAIFFFFSGYGLYTSLKEKPDYLNHFFRKRLSSVLVPFYMANTIYAVFFLIFSGEKLSALDLVAVFTGWLLLNNNLWFIVEIVFLYVGFYIFFKFIKNKNIACFAMAAYIFIMVAVALLLGHDYETISAGRWFHGEWWYNTTWTFFIGLMIARFKDKIVNMVKKKYPAFLIGSIAVFFILWFNSLYMMGRYGYYYEDVDYPGYFEKFMSLIAQCPAAIAFVLMLLIISMKLKFSNKVLDFLGKISIELFLIHHMYLVIFGTLIENNVLFFICVYAGSILTAILLHFVDGKIINAIKGNK